MYYRQILTVVGKKDHIGQKQLNTNAGSIENGVFTRCGWMATFC